MTNARRFGVLIVVCGAFIGGAGDAPKMPKGCEVVGKWGAMVTATCPSETSPSEIAAWIVSIKGEHMTRIAAALPRLGRQVGFYVFKKRAPKTMKELDALIDNAPAFDAQQLARGLFNENTGVAEFACKRSPTDKKVGQCNDLLR